MPTTEQCIEVTDFDANALPRQAVFKSTETRFEEPRALSLGPAAYVNNTDPVYMMKGVVSGAFGTQAERTDLMQRDVSRSPYKDPTKIDNPSPDRYNTQCKTNKTTFVGGTKFGSQQTYEEPQSIKDLTKYNPD